MPPPLLLQFYSVFTPGFCWGSTRALSFPWHVNQQILLVWTPKNFCLVVSSLTRPKLLGKQRNLYLFDEIHCLNNQFWRVWPSLRWKVKTLIIYGNSECARTIKGAPLLKNLAASYPSSLLRRRCFWCSGRVGRRRKSCPIKVYSAPTPPPPLYNQLCPPLPCLLVVFIFAFQSRHLNPKLFDFPTSRLLIERCC